MAKIGVSKPYYAIYSEADGVVTYSNGGVLGKATEVGVTINTSEDNNLYADNGIAETDRAFSDGTLTIGTDDLGLEVSKVILGAKEQDLGDIDGVTDEGVKELVFDDEMSSPYLGVGFIVKGQKNNKVYWRALVFTKIMFNVPDDAVTTQGESIDWQTPSLVSTILRDDTPTHMWKREATFTTEAQAESYIKNRLNITATAAPEAQALRAAPARTTAAKETV